jgi:hypothetical protein
LYFTRPLKINPAISEELESVARIGFILDGFVDIASCSVAEKRCSDINKSKENIFFIFNLCDVKL